MKKHYLKTGSKKVMSAVLLAATMMVGLAACGGGNAEENTQPESSVVESTVESSVESSIEESTEEGSVEGSDVSGSEDEAVETRTYTLMINDVETEFEETLFRSEDGFSIWYPAELLEAAEIDGYDGFLQLNVEGEAEISVMIVPVDAALDIDEMLQEAANGYGEDAEVTVGEILDLELETDSEMIVKSMEVSYADLADRFYAVNDGENAVLITVKANTEAMKEMSSHFDRIATNVEFPVNKAEE